MRKITPMWRARAGRVAVLGAVLVSLMACGISTLSGGSASGTGGTGCAVTNCPPPARSAQVAHTYSAHGFTFQYFDPWQISSQDATGAVVAAATNYGDLSVQFESTTVAAGTSPQALLASAVQGIDTSQIPDLAQQGPIYGAAIGYIAGAGAGYTGTAYPPNAPSVPVFLEIMASVRGTTGVVFLATSSLDPNGPNPTDPRQVPNGEYDRMVNSVVWK
ncbi:MAG TPA: hypothetical protein VIG30_08665 [Ktedonobacterales bacterium]|jgi:hypothetical protein